MRFRFFGNAFQVKQNAPLVGRTSSHPQLPRLLTCSQQYPCWAKEVFGRVDDNGQLVPYEDRYKTHRLVVKGLAAIASKIPEVGKAVEFAISFAGGQLYGTEEDEKRAFLEHSFNEIKEQLQSCTKEVIAAVKSENVRILATKVATRVQVVKHTIESFESSKLFDDQTWDPNSNRNAQIEVSTSLCS